MGEYSWKAARKPVKGRLSNALFVVASAEEPPLELHGVASRLTIILPWGGLLRTVALPDPDNLSKVRSLCAAGAEIEVVMSYDATRDPVSANRLALQPLSEARIRCEVASGYLDAGISITDAKQMSCADLRTIPSTWAKRLAFGRPRPAWRIRAKAV